MLTCDEIKRLNIIRDADANSYRAASYDLRIGTIIKPDGVETNLYSLPAQGIVDVVSRERLVLPEDIAGIALVKRVYAMKEFFRSVSVSSIPDMRVNYRASLLILVKTPEL